MSKILFIGGSRFLGPRIILNLLKNGADITLFNRGHSYGQKIPKNVDWIKGDRLNPRDLMQLKKGNYLPSMVSIISFGTSPLNSPLAR